MDKLLLCEQVFKRNHIFIFLKKARNEQIYHKSLAFINTLESIIMYVEIKMRFFYSLWKGFAKLMKGISKDSDLFNECQASSATYQRA